MLFEIKKNTFRFAKKMHQFEKLKLIFEINITFARVRDRSGKPTAPCSFSGMV
jgi:hypothetical protein